MNVDFSRPILSLDTSTSFLSLALQVDGVMLTRHIEVGNRQSDLILPQLAEMFAETSISAADLGGIIYAKGPGAFTGLRIGIGVAQGLAAPFCTPLIAVPTLDAVAALLPNQPCVLAAIDARMGEVFYAWFDTQAGQQLSLYQVGKASEIRQPEQTMHLVPQGIGNAFALVDTPPFHGNPSMPTAADYLLLATTGRYTVVSAAHAELLYVRDKIALTATEQAERKMQETRQ